MVCVSLCIAQSCISVAMACMRLVGSRAALASHVSKHGRIAFQCLPAGHARTECRTCRLLLCSTGHVCTELFWHFQALDSHDALWHSAQQHEPPHPGMPCFSGLWHSPGGQRVCWGLGCRVGYAVACFKHLQHRLVLPRSPRLGAELRLMLYDGPCLVSADSEILWCQQAGTHSFRCGSFQWSSITHMFGTSISSTSMLTPSAC